MLSSFLGYIIEILGREWIFLTIICIAILIELMTKKVKKKLKSKIFTYSEDADSVHDREYYLEYYKKIQGIDIIRSFSFTIAISLILVGKAGLNINFFALAAGALIVIFKDLWISIAAFFIVVPQYRIGDTISIDGIQGQIIFIRVFSVGILGKDANGESTGQLYMVPNFKFLSENIRKEQIGSDEIMRDFFQIPYKKEWFDTEFDTFMEELKKYLDTIFPMGSRKNIGNYQSYIGYRYKLDYEYREDKCLMIQLSFVGKPDRNHRNMEKIIAFIEGKKGKKENIEE